MSCNLDGLADESVIFSNCCCNSPLCVPARAVLQTGQYISRNGAWNNQLAADPKSPSYVRSILDAGYHTAVIGKTHLWTHSLKMDAVNLDLHSDQHKDILREWGFEHIVELTGPMSSTLHNSPYTDYLKEKGLLKAYRGYQIDYLARNYVMKLFGEIPPKYKKLMEQFDLPTDLKRDPNWLESPLPLPEEDRYDSFTGREAVKWIDGYGKDRPFYLMVGFQGPHDPFDAPAEYRAMYDPSAITPGIFDPPAAPVPEYLKQLLALTDLEDMSVGHMQEMIVAYYSKVTHIDDYIGRIMEALRRRDMLDNTWIVYTSDHGEMLGDHRLTHKMTFYESGLKIPCLIRPPGGTSSKKIDALTDQLDLSATLLDIANADPFTDSEGRSLKPLISAAPDVTLEELCKDVIFSELGGLVAVFDGRYKLVVEVQNREPLQMYDLESDPRELSNVVNQPSVAPIQGELAQKIDDHLNRHLDPEQFAAFQQEGASRF